MDQIGRHVRESDRPFGGIQLVLCGDFFQLPPVAGVYLGAIHTNPRMNDVVQIAEASNPRL